jgi:hypothetical protein
MTQSAERMASTETLQKNGIASPVFNTGSQ